MKKIVFKLIFVFISAFCFAQSSDVLAERYVRKADAALNEGDVTEAYKLISTALKSTKADESDSVPENIIVTAKRVYLEYIKQLHLNYIDLALFDINQNLERFPEMKSPELVEAVNNLKTKGKASTFGEQISLVLDEETAVCVGNKLGEQILFTSNSKTPSGKTIVKSVMPYQEGFVIKFTENFNASVDFYGAVGSVFFVDGNKCQITAIYPNGFKIKTTKK